jgi:hypothetical protein
MENHQLAVDIFKNQMQDSKQIKIKKAQGI